MTNKELMALVKEALGAESNYPSIKWTCEPSKDDKDGVVICAKLDFNVDDLHYSLKASSSTMEDSVSVKSAIEAINEGFVTQMDKKLNQIFGIIPTDD